MSAEQLTLDTYLDKEIAQPHITGFGLRTHCTWRRARRVAEEKPLAERLEKIIPSSDAEEESLDLLYLTPSTRYRNIQTSPEWLKTHSHMPASPQTRRKWKTTLVQQTILSQILSFSELHAEPITDRLSKLEEVLRINNIALLSPLFPVTDSHSEEKEEVMG
ncbi:hypothetical protein FA15DRAFT_661945 [Coprinopsis marcescibilis]|uniref:Uncharacterized protein n=1 Tax=Coprinopsis marcescibilis TaxID=230819 RepID=A0A5C3KA38_COPMA|nr:hypothetical protein FA15DRAFT_661945 [Coprinopsis marcescibilis]